MDFTHINCVVFYDITSEAKEPYLFPCEVLICLIHVSNATLICTVCILSTHKLIELRANH